MLSNPRLERRTKSRGLGGKPQGGRAHVPNQPWSPGSGPERKAGGPSSIYGTPCHGCYRGISHSQRRWGPTHTLPQCPQNPNPKHIHSGERPHLAPLQGPTTQLLRPRQTFTFLIISSRRLPSGCLCRGWWRSELYPAGWASPPHCFLPGELAVRGDHSNRMHVLAPHTEAPKQAGHTDRHTEGQAGIKPDFPTEHSAHTARPYSEEDTPRGEKPQLPPPQANMPVWHTLPSLPKGPLVSGSLPVTPAFSLWSALAASFCTTSATHSRGGPGKAGELCGPTEPAPFLLLLCCRGP